MIRTRLNEAPSDLPSSIAEVVAGAPIYDSSCSPEARVYFIDRDTGFFLKRAKAGTLRKEAEMDVFFHSRGLGAEVIDYITADHDWLITRRVRGEDMTHTDYLSDPKRLCDTLAYRLRELHEQDTTGCPVTDRVCDYLSYAEERYREGIFDTSLYPDGCEWRCADDAWRFISENKSLLRSDVLIHGDYCLPNVILDEWRLSGFIDLGGGGIGDRHIDLFWGAWTLRYNLKTDELRERFLDAYGRELINPDAMRVVGAAELFG